MNRDVHPFSQPLDEGNGHLEQDSSNSGAEARYQLWGPRPGTFKPSEVSMIGSGEWAGSSLAPPQPSLILLPVGLLCQSLETQ